MTEIDMQIVAAMAGAAVAITAADLILSLLRHRRARAARSLGPPVDAPPSDGGAGAPSGTWAARRLAAIQEASGKATQ